MTHLKIYREDSPLSSRAGRNCLAGPPDVSLDDMPVVPRPLRQQHLAKRLQAVLKGGAEAIGGHAAALYLLDEATTRLELRCSWGLPPRRLAEPPRPLQSALADLEAMLGHAVVLEDTTLLGHWNAPEGFLAAACLPVSTPTTILGTFWVFSTTRRSFTDSQTNILEIVAGRLAVELEREMLLAEGLSDSPQLKQQLAVAERIQRNQLPTIAPLLDGWELAGWAGQNRGLGGSFYDWFCLPRGLLAVAVGCANETGIPAALVANNVKTALRCHAQHHHDANHLLGQVNLTLWTGSAGDQSASLSCGLVETKTGYVRHAFGGRTGCLLLRPDGWESLSKPSLCVGESPEAEFERHGIELQPGQALLLFTHGCHRGAMPSRCSPGEAAVAEFLTGQLEAPTKELVVLARDRLEGTSHCTSPHDRAILVVKRTHGGESGC